MGTYAAIDLGASSGRVAVGTINNNKFEIEVVHRFDNYQKSEHPGEALWDWRVITSEILTGLTKATEKFDLDSVAVDSWAVDYVLFNRDHEIVAPVYSYRDDRTDGRMEIVQNDHDIQEIYSRTGIQFQPFNTIYQLLAAKDSGQLHENTFLLIPDAINNFLCKSNSTEETNASTTQLYDYAAQNWYWDLIDQVGLPRSIFPAIHKPLVVLGEITGHGKLDGIRVVSVGSHDTASAIAGTPLSENERNIYISSGTWSLIGTEASQPHTTEAALNANLTNELGIQETVRFLKNVSGMWIISECLREWEHKGIHISIVDLINGASKCATSARIDPNDPLFLHPGPMVDRINYYLRTHEQMELTDPYEIARCIFESLAITYKSAISEIAAVTGDTFANIHIVGGGSANTLLNQLTADHTGLPVVAGPIEATLIGNIGSQAIVAGQIADLQELRKLIKNNFELREYKPTKGNHNDNAQ